MVYNDDAVTARIDSNHIVLDVTQFVDVDNLTALAISRGDFAIHEVYTREEVFHKLIPVPAEIQTMSAHAGLLNERGEILYSAANDTSRIVSIIKPLLAQALPGTTFYWGRLENGEFPLYAIKHDNATAMTKNMVGSSKPDFDQAGYHAVAMHFKKSYETLWSDVTEKNIGRSLAVVLDNTVLCAPRVNSRIPMGVMQISGQYNKPEVDRIAALIASPTLPTKLSVQKIDSAMLVHPRGYPTLAQIHRYNRIRAGYLQYQDSMAYLLNALSPSKRNTMQRELNRLYTNDLNTIADQTEASSEVIDEVLFKMETVLNNITGVQNNTAEALSTLEDLEGLGEKPIK